MSNKADQLQDQILGFFLNSNDMNHFSLQPKNSKKPFAIPISIQSMSSTLQKNFQDKLIERILDHTKDLTTLNTKEALFPVAKYLRNKFKSYKEANIAQFITILENGILMISHIVIEDALKKPEPIIEDSSDEVTSNKQIKLVKVEDKNFTNKGIADSYKKMNNVPTKNDDKKRPNNEPLQPIVKSIQY